MVKFNYTNTHPKQNSILHAQDINKYSDVNSMQTGNYPTVHTNELEKCSSSKSAFVAWSTALNQSNQKLVSCDNTYKQVS